MLNYYSMSHHKLFMFNPWRKDRSRELWASRQIDFIHCDNRAEIKSLRVTCQNVWKWRGKTWRITESVRQQDFDVYTHFRQRMKSGRNGEHSPSWLNKEPKLNAIPYISFGTSCILYRPLINWPINQFVPLCFWTKEAIHYTHDILQHSHLEVHITLDTWSAGERRDETRSENDPFVLSLPELFLAKKKRFDWQWKSPSGYSPPHFNPWDPNVIRHLLRVATSKQRRVSCSAHCAGNKVDDEAKEKRWTRNRRVAQSMNNKNPPTASAQGCNISTVSLLWSGTFPSQLANKKKVERRKRETVVHRISVGIIA